MVIDNPQRIWRSGRLLVMHVNATLPDRCVKTNQPAGGKRLKKKLSWHHPALYLLILVNLIAYLIIALCVRKRATIEIGVSDSVLQQRARASAAGWILCIGGIGLFVIGLIRYESLWILMILGGLSFLSGLIWAAVGMAVVAPARIETDYVWLKGVCKEYLAEFPDWSTR